MGSQSPASDLPQSLYDAAARAGLHIEDNEILHSADQTEQICIDHWLTGHDGGIRLEVRVLYREPLARMASESVDATVLQGPWQTIAEGRRSEPISEVAALGLIEAWAEQQRLLIRLRHDAQEREFRQALNHGQQGQQAQFAPSQR